MHVYIMHVCMYARSHDLDCRFVSRYSRNSSQEEAARHRGKERGVPLSHGEDSQLSYLRARQRAGLQLREWAQVRARLCPSPNTHHTLLYTTKKACGIEAWAGPLTSRPTQRFQSRHDSNSSDTSSNACQHPNIQSETLTLWILGSCTPGNGLTGPSGQEPKREA